MELSPKNNAKFDVVFNKEYKSNLKLIYFWHEILLSLLVFGRNKTKLAKN